MPSHKRRIHRSKKNRKPILIAAFMVAIIAIAIVAYIMINSSGSQGPSNSISSKNKVLFTTSMGNITIQLRDDMPITTENFKKLVQQGKYDGTTFHRVIADFMIQGGQINSYWSSIQDEFSSNNYNVKGTIAMAKTSQPNSASTQFFINVVDNSNRSATFDSTYSVFGDVIDGMDVADAISQVAIDQNDSPLEPVTLIKAELID
jgi:cyclophilin family peptidyl-prolyl cis-trans isomerase